MNRKLFLLFACFAPLLLNFNSAKGQPVATDKESARIFVQKFYDWYSVLFDADSTLKPGKLYSQQIAMIHSREFFSNNLRKALTDYYGRPIKSDDDIGLDFDPFIAGQDSWDGYQTCGVKQVGNKFWVDVHDIKKGQPQKAILAAQIIAVAEVTKEGGHWVITNFEYPPAGDRANLMEILESQKKTETGRK